MQLSRLANTAQSSTQIWDLEIGLVLHKMQFVIWIVSLTTLPLVEVIEGDEKHHYEYYHNCAEG